MSKFQDIYEIFINKYLLFIFMRKGRIKRFLKHEPVTLMGDYLNSIKIIKSLKKHEKKLHKVNIKMFKKYSEDQINKLTDSKQKEIQKHPNKTIELNEKYKNQLKELSKGFCDDSIELIDLFIVVFSELDKMVEFDDREESEDLLMIREVLTKCMDYKEVMIFTDKSISEFEHDFKRLEKKVYHQIKLDYKNDKRELHGREPKHMGYLRSHKNNRSLSKQILKADKKLGKSEGYFKEIKGHLLEQLDKGVLPSFMGEFTGFIDEYSDIEKLILIIREDVREIISHHLNEHNNMIHHVNTFIMIMRRLIKEIETSKLSKKIDEFYEEGENGSIGKKAIDFLNKDIQAERAIYSELMQDEKLFKEFLAKVQRDKHQLHKS